MAAIRMTLVGDREMKRKLESCAREFPLEARRGTNVVANRKADIAQERAPEKTGKLKATKRVSVSIKKKGPHPNISATIKFGGPDVLYARRVHETHKTHSKFLESVIQESVGSIGADLAREIDLKKAASA